MLLFTPIRRLMKDQRHTLENGRYRSSRFNLLDPGPTVRGDVQGYAAEFGIETDSDPEGQTTYCFFVRLKLRDHYSMPLCFVGGMPLSRLANAQLRRGWIVQYIGGFVPARELAEKLEHTHLPAVKSYMMRLVQLARDAESGEWDVDAEISERRTLWIRNARRLLAVAILIGLMAGAGYGAYRAFVSPVIQQDIPATGPTE